VVDGADVVELGVADMVEPEESVVIDPPSVDEPKPVKGIIGGAVPIGVTTTFGVCVGGGLKTPTLKGAGTTPLPLPLFTKGTPFKGLNAACLFTIS